MSIAVSTTSQILRHPGIRWIGGGWTFFLAENIIITENREWLINDVLKSERAYHMCFNTLSTLATASIVYGYFRFPFFCFVFTKKKNFLFFWGMGETKDLYFGHQEKYQLFSVTKKWEQTSFLNRNWRTVVFLFCGKIESIEKK
jgi:hypothetical protein